MSRGFGVIFYDVSRGKMLHEKSTRNTNTSPFSLEKRVFPYHESLTNSKMLHILHMENRSAFNYARMLLLVVLMPEGGSLTQQFPTSYYYSMSSKIILTFQDFPFVPIVMITILFSLLRMAEICESPFDYDHNYWDVDVKKEIDIQLFIGSLALYPKYAAPPRPQIPNLNGFRIPDELN